MHQTVLHTFATMVKLMVHDLKPKQATPCFIFGSVPAKLVTLVFFVNITQALMY